MRGTRSREITIGTRKSRMAQYQADQIRKRLAESFPGMPFRLVTVATAGDAHPALSLQAFQRPGIFTSGLEAALLEKRVDLAVHSLKDLPLAGPREIALGAVLRREEPADALVIRNGRGWRDLERGACIGTSSPRRERMLRSLGQAFRPMPVRGNVDTRVRRLDQGAAGDALVVAACGLRRLGLTHRIALEFKVEEYLTAPGQGAVAIQCLAQNQEIRELARPLHDEPTFQCTLAERTLLEGLGGGCALAVAAYACMEGKDICLHGLIRSRDGQTAVRRSARHRDPRRAAHQAAQALIGAGGLALL